VIDDRFEAERYQWVQENSALRSTRADRKYVNLYNHDREDLIGFFICNGGKIRVGVRMEAMSCVESFLLSVKRQLR
jgi:hypothetical protein